nr:argininosuccinate synthase [Spirochaetota bacterium]
KALAPSLKVIAPWRNWDISSREEAIAYAKKKNIPLNNISEKKIYSRDRNIWHISHEGGELEDLRNRPNEEMFVLSASPKEAPDKETIITIDFEKGIPVGIDGKKTDGISLLKYLNKVGGENGIGRSDILENRLVGMKSHGVYETPGGTILYAALQELRATVLDKDSLKMVNSLSPQYAEIIYNGKYFTNLRKSMEIFFRETMKFATGSIKLVLYKGNIIIAGRDSKYSLYNADIASFTTGANYSHTDSKGFINLFGLQVGIEAAVQK